VILSPRDLASGPRLINVESSINMGHS